MKKYTIVLHHYIGYGSYGVQVQRVKCGKRGLEQLKRDEDVHFIINGWPKTSYPDGTDAFAGESDKAETKE